MLPPFTILNPCQKRWAEWAGDGRTRHCNDCDHNVYEFDRYSRQELKRIQREEGSLCGYLNSAAPQPTLNRRAVLVGALLTAISPLMAQTGSVRILVTDSTRWQLAGVYAALLDGSGKIVRTERSNEAGEVVIANHPVGNHRIDLVSAGFRRRELIVLIRNAAEVKVETILEVGETGGVMFPPSAKRRWWTFR